MLYVAMHRICVVFVSCRENMHLLKQMQCSVVLEDAFRVMFMRYEMREEICCNSARFHEV